MNGPTYPSTNDVVLIGGGHTHALVLRKWGMNPLPGARLTVINPGPTAPYSGMLPGHVAGHYGRDELDIDLVQLARFAGARVILGAADGIDLENQTVDVPGRPPIGYDLCSIDVGITSAMPALPGFTDYAVPAKPLGGFARAWQNYLDGTGPGHVAVIGAGIAGTELALAMAYALRRRGRDAQVTLIDQSAALSDTRARAANKLRSQLTGQGIELLEYSPVERVERGGVILAGGRKVKADFITGAAGARPHDWIAATGLDLTEGFITVNAQLQSGDRAVFAVGDCAHLDQAPRPKAGVYAVRQAPVLYDNLRAALTGKPMRAYTPQKEYLKLISLGQKHAVAERFGLAPSGRLMWRWKDHIDRKFMRQFRGLPAMTTDALPPMHTMELAEIMGDKPMCAGCGAKVGRGTLQSVLQNNPATRQDGITVLPGDDAALIQTGGVRQVMTSDHLRAFTNDPVLMTRIAAIHALGDIWAMGASPQAATATLILPRQSDRLQARMLNEIMDTAHDVMSQAGAAIVGGHTSLGDDLTVGFTLTGICNGDPVTLSGGQPGDVLILTKPVGSGVLLAGEMQMKAKGAWMTGCYAHMTRSQADASAVLAGAHAMTDVTGFGLAGHLLNICEASGAAAEIDIDAVPFVEGALKLAEAGIRSTLYPQNRALAPNLPDMADCDLLFDPQTAGGLLAAVPADRADAILAELTDLKYPARAIGKLRAGPPRITLKGA